MPIVYSYEIGNVVGGSGGSLWVCDILYNLQALFEQMVAF